MTGEKDSEGREGGQSRRELFRGALGLAALSMGVSSASASSGSKQGPRITMGDDWTINDDDRNFDIINQKTGASARYFDGADEWRFSGGVRTPGVDTGRVNNVEKIRDASDLPNPSDGTHTLEDNTAYHFNGFVSSTAALELGSPSPLIGTHGGVDGFIYTGGSGAAIRSSGAPFFARDASFLAPGADMFDLTANATTEMLVESCSFSDPVGLGNIASLGTIDGYRVPSFKGCNFEHFDGGLTFDGTPDKIFFEGCPFRNVTASNVTIITLASTLDVSIAKMSTDCYVKDVQSDTVVIHAESGSQPTEYYKHINVDHDTSVTKSNILTGDIGAEKVGTVVADSLPLADSSVTGDLDLDSPTTVVGSGAGPTQVTGTFNLNNAERTSSPSSGVMQYDGKPDQEKVIHVNASVSGANTEFAVYVGKNGSEIPRSKSRGFLPNSSNPTGGLSIASLDFETGDTFSAFIENVGGTKDLDVEDLALTI